jgi:NAD/NADP transhydrogenase beta subunit
MVICGIIGGLIFAFIFRFRTASYVLFALLTIGSLFPLSDHGCLAMIGGLIGGAIISAICLYLTTLSFTIAIIIGIIIGAIIGMVLKKKILR